MIVVPGPVEFAMGSPDDEPGRSSNEVLHQQRINRSFAVAAVPVTVEQFERFLKARPGTRQALNEGRGDLFVKRYSPQPDRPMIVVNWFMAAEYCNWLSGQEGLPPEEWCYEPTMVPASVLLARTVASLGSSGQPRPLLALCDMALNSGRDLAGEYGEGMRMKKDYLRRTGYRLPTESERECAARAGTTTQWSHGEAEDLLTSYAWYNAQGENHTRQVAHLKPNARGLFDMHGNVFDWCQDRSANYDRPVAGKPAEDKEHNDDMSSITGNEGRVMRGGSFGNQALVGRSAYRNKLVPTNRISTIGFRPARTLPPGSFPALPPAAEDGRK